MIFSTDEYDWEHAKKIGRLMNLTEQIENENKIRYERMVRKQSLSQKSEVLESGEGQCYICRMENSNLLEVHHIVPIKDGGDGSFENMVLLCPNCHAIVHNCIRCMNEKSVQKWCMQDWIDEFWSKNQHDRFSDICKKYIYGR